MTALRPHLAAAAGIFRRDATVYLSYRWRLGTQYVGVLFTLAVFYYISRLVRVGTFPSPDTYFSYAAVGVIILQVLQSTLDIPGAVRQELVAGTFERMAVSPFGPVWSILALFLFPLALAVVTMLVTLALGVVVFGLDARWSTVPLAVPVALVGAMALGAIALLFAGHGGPLQAGSGRRVRAGGDLARGGVLLPTFAAPVVAGLGFGRAAVHPRRRPLAPPAGRAALAALSVGRGREARRLHRRLAPTRARGVVVGGRSRPPAGYAHGVLDDLARSGATGRPVPEHVVYRDFAEQTVALNLQTGRYTASTRRRHDARCAS